MKSPEHCIDLKDIRNAIDGIDKEIIRLLRKRLDYVLAAAQFKPTEASIPAPERVAEMLTARRVWATAEGLSAEFITALFRQIIRWFIAIQITHWRQLHRTGPQRGKQAPE